tara:strand:- start:505 stop:825 length:321 start_codon:yes stop_codon:yes gene_type:complete
MERYFYFGEPTVETTGENAMYPLSSFLGMTPVDANNTTMHFKSRNGELTDDVIAITHEGHTPKSFMAEVVGYLQRNQKNPFLIIRDGVSGVDVTNKIVAVSIVTAA